MLPAFPSTAAEPLPLSLTENPASVSSAPPIAIGALPSTGNHLVRPREEVVQHELRKRGWIDASTPPDRVRTLLRDYYGELAKESRVWASPEVQERARRRQESPATAGATAMASASCAVQPVTVKILALAVEFGGTDTFTYAGTDGGACRYKTVTVSGPLKGEIPHPGPRDNNTVWYDPALTADAKFYEKLIFGYEGVGRVRMDLVDPNDGLLGINLQGYTVQDYYDQMAGKGNVALDGTVAGWITLDHSEGYYGAPNCFNNRKDGGGPATVAQMVKDAVTKFNQAHPEYYNDTSPDAFWPRFDANHDGILDTLWIIHAGMAQEAGGGPQGELAVWSQSSDLTGAAFKVYEGNPETTADDIIIGPYTVQPENADLGVLVEEFGHNFFGLPDLYTTDIENSIGFWSIMSGGVWGGWLGGATPVGMPLWFRMIADCGGKPCNWHLPILTRNFNDPAADVTIGRLENTPGGTYKGVRINLPDTVSTGVANRAGTGKGAYTDTGRDNLDITLRRTIDVPLNGTGLLTFMSYWDMEEDRDYGYVQVKDGTRWVFLDDLDGVLRETNPYGANLGHGLTGSGNRMLRFDLSPYKGRKIVLRLRYRTDSSNTGPGWWVDNVRLDNKTLSNFENCTPPDTFPGWTNSNPGWVVVPATPSYAHYYLVEWRAPTKYDKMLRTAYVNRYIDDDEWQVERIPYNIPGAVLYYCNTAYPFTSSLRTNLTKAPSIGPKHPLLVVDMNYGPMRLGDTGIVIDARRASYDAALTLQPSRRITIQQYDTGASVIDGPWTFPPKPAVTRFDDALGYYAGVYSGSPCTTTYCYANEGGSAVIPAFGPYTTRVTHYDGSPYPELYGRPYKGSILGTGNPGDQGLALGVRIELLEKTSDNRKVTLRINGDN